MKAIISSASFFVVGIAVGILARPSLSRGVRAGRDLATPPPQSTESSALAGSNITTAAAGNPERDIESAFLRALARGRSGGRSQLEEFIGSLAPAEISRAIAAAQGLTNRLDR